MAPLAFFLSLYLLPTVFGDVVKVEKEKERKTGGKRVGVRRRKVLLYNEWLRKQAM